MLRRYVVPLTVLALGASVALIGAPVSASPGAPAHYEVYDLRTEAQRAAITASGATIDDIADGVADITATRAQAADLSRHLTVKQIPDSGTAGAQPESAGDFPPSDSAYHTYPEMMADLQAEAKAHPQTMMMFSIGTTYQGRQIPIVKISNNVKVDQNEPEVLYDAHQHAREHLTVEMALYLVHLYVDGYDKDPRITRIVNSRELWIVPDMNPDGGAFDIASGHYQSWRKNRQPNSGGTVGTDLNRNWAYRWACCKGSSNDPSNETYHGPAAFSAPETQALRNFVLSRRINGVQQIKTNIDFHTYSELVLWPFSFTKSDTTGLMNADQAAAFQTLGDKMAKSNGYTPEQSSDLYISDGDSIDWMWATQGIFAYTFEMYPNTEQQGGFYPPASVIPAQTARDKEASLEIAEYADCPYRIISKQAQYCH